MKLMFNLDKKRKESILIIVLITFLLFATISLIILNINLPKKTVKENPSNHNQINTAQTENSIPNPLIDKAEIERVEKYYNTGDNEDQKPVKTNIQYQFELSPDLKKKKTALPYAYAASTCNIDTAPSDISAYILKANWTTFEALKVANTFGISSEQ